MMAALSMRPHGHGALAPVSAVSSAMDWPSLWQAVSQELKRLHYSRQTLRVYRQVLRGFRRHLLQIGSPAASRPSALTPDCVRRFLYAIADDAVSASWQGLNLAVIRTVFDRLAGHAISSAMPYPRRGRHLPDVLSHEEIDRLIEAASSVRDRLLIGFLYGCGLKVGEVCALRWSDIDLAEKTIRIAAIGSRLSGCQVVELPSSTPQPGTPSPIPSPTRNQEPRTPSPLPPPLPPIPNLQSSLFNIQFCSPIRTVPLPEDLVDIIGKGQSLCPGQDPIFPGNRACLALTGRQMERVIRAAARRAGIGKPVTCMTLRHTYAVHCLQAGDTIRQVQEHLGLRDIERVLIYQDLIVSPEARAAVNSLTAGMRLFPERNTAAPPAPRSPEQTDFKTRLALVSLPFPRFGWTPGGFLAHLKTAAARCFLSGRLPRAPS